MTDLIDEQGGYSDHFANDEYHQRLIDADCFSDAEIDFLRMKKLQREQIGDISKKDYLKLKRELEKIEEKRKKPKQQVRGQKKIVKCKICKKEFEARIADLNRGWAKYCSKSCKGKSSDNKGSYLDSYHSFLRSI
jgi:hypothetical protein